jgi:ABC-type glycerol-3-phosphate transport system substrate-binding protein
MKLPSLPGLCFLICVLAGCGKPPGDGRVHVSYWEKWTDSEGDAMQEVVDAFNRSQDRITVDYLNVSQVDQKTLLATAGGDPPDIAGIWQENIYSFADNNALMPLDDFMRADRTNPKDWTDRYEKVFGNMVSYRNSVWALPSACTVYALHWNKRMFREAGLDPERPPRTLEELDSDAERLTKRDANGNLTQMGYLPQQPMYVTWTFPLWFGGQLFVDNQITADRYPANVATYEWVQNYSRKYGVRAINNFAGGFGEMASAQDPFFSEKVGMVIQGVWYNNYMRQFAPGLEYGAAPWPAAKPGLEDFTVAQADVLAIPRAARHSREAWEFIKYFSTINPEAQAEEELRGIELLSYLQQKQSPLKQWSPFFENHHPHPYIGVFRKLAESPHAVFSYKMGIWEEYNREIESVFDSARLLESTPQEALGFCQQRISESWRWHQEHMRREMEHGIVPRQAAAPEPGARIAQP